jgi:uncharacterized protein YciI
MRKFRIKAARPTAMLFAVINTRGPAYRHGAPMEAQEAWRAHADFMNALVDDGFVVLGGPLDEPDVLLIIRAESADAIRARLEPDPWHRMGLLVIKSISPWTLRLGTLP